MKIKCISCNKKDSKEYITIKQWVINHKEEAHYGKNYNIHASCIDNVLKYEPKEGFIYGKITTNG